MPSIRNSLKNINIKKFYDPACDGSDLINDFYIPCLSVSKKYDRISAYFSSGVLKSFCKGLHALINNNGKIRFIFSCEINDDDLKMISQAYENKMDALVNNLENDFSLINDFEVSNLGYLIENGLAEVKIAFMLNTEASLCHLKSGIFADEQNNKIYFNGSGNETENGIFNNADQYFIFRSFVDVENDYVKIGEETFEKLWNNTYSSKVYTAFPKGKLFEKLISYSKKRTFNSDIDFYEFNDAFFIDLDEGNKCINVYDFTKEKYLSFSTIRQSFGTKLYLAKNNIYKTETLTLHILRDLIIGKLKLKGYSYILSETVEKYLKNADLEINKRIKLAAAIKENKNLDLRSNNFYKFKAIVDNETYLRLKDNQVKNSYFHYVMKSSADYSVPGTGKTFISYGLYAFLTSNKQNDSRIDKMLVLCPLNAFAARIDEGNNIFADKRRLSFFDIRQHSGDYENELKKRKFDVYLFNYEFFNKNDKYEILLDYLIDDKTLLICDEVHKLKSINGTRATTIINVLSNAKSKPIYKLLLTGTPMPNSFQDIYNYLKILYPDDLMSFFKNININNLKTADNNFYKAEEIKKALLPTFVRITKRDLSISIPEPDDYNTLNVLPTDMETKLYEYIWKNYSSNPLLKFIRLIQAASNPQLLKVEVDSSELEIIVNDDEKEEDEYGINSFLYSYNLQDNGNLNSKEYIDLINSIGMSSKTKRSIDFIEKTVRNREKILVWCLFVSTIELLKSELINRGIRVESIYGIDSYDVRDQKINGFKSNEFDVLITNPNTLAESISLHKVCHKAIYLEYGFNLTYMIQSKDRINRVGLPPNQKTYYYYAISHKTEFGFGSIDELILERLDNKAKRMLNIIESNDICVFNDGTNERDDIEYILSQYKL